MVALERVSSNIRLLNHDGNHIRTFSGVRHNLTRNAVSDFMEGVNGITVRPATNALLTVRTELREEVGS